MLGFALNQLHQVDAALATYSEGVALYPNDAELLINYGNLLLSRQRASEALPFLRKVAQLRPGHAVSWIVLSDACHALRLYQEGFDAADKALGLASSRESSAAALTKRAIHRR
ncbi:hypothetical protein, partial [Leptospira sp. SA-E8]|uniref:hypothetical protein n=1 Tax=Leptospira sp. SA-E8 TaxID=3422259 RepID=UPI003EBE231B